MATLNRNTYFRKMRLSKNCVILSSHKKAGIFLPKWFPWVVPRCFYFIRVSCSHLNQCFAFLTKILQYYVCSRLMVYKCLFSRRRNVVNDVASQTASGSELQNIGPSTAKARSANCQRCGAGIRCECADDRKSQRRTISIDFTTKSEKYVGASPWVAL